MQKWMQWIGVVSPDAVLPIVGALLPPWGIKQYLIVHATAALRMRVEEFDIILTNWLINDGEDQNPETRRTR
jgi:hypothetical protein